MVKIIASIDNKYILRAPQLQIQWYFMLIYTAIYIKIVSKYDMFLNVLEFIVITFRCCNLIRSKHTVSHCIFLN